MKSNWIICSALAAGLFGGCATEYKFYAPGTGVIAEMDSDDGLKLKSPTTK